MMMPGKAVSPYCVPPSRISTMSINGTFPLLRLYNTQKRFAQGQSPILPGNHLLPVLLSFLRLLLRVTPARYTGAFGWRDEVPARSVALTMWSAEFIPLLLVGRVNRMRLISRVARPGTAGNQWYKRRCHTWELVI